MAGEVLIRKEIVERGKERLDLLRVGRVARVDGRLGLLRQGIELAGIARRERDPHAGGGALASQ